MSSLVKILYRLSQPFADRVFCQNEEDFQLLSSGSLVPMQRLSLVPGSGVDTSRFRPELKMTHNSSFRFLYIGRLLGDKGVYELVAAAQALHESGLEFELWICGFVDVENVSAIGETELQCWSKEKYIRWLGATDRVEDALAQVDCVVLASYREGMPRSLLEAGSMGLPVIATDVAGCRSIVEDGVNGLLCQPNDVDSLACAMQYMAETPSDSRDEMGKRARERVVSRFDERIVVEATMAAIDSVVAADSSYPRD